MTKESGPPPGVAEAMFNMSGTVKKDAKNEFHEYEYASADAVYAEVRAHLAQQGLAPWQDELSLETFTTENNKGKKVLWVEVTYEMALTPNGGKLQEPGERVTIFAEVTGPQSMGAIRTYALKYWLRGKLLISTGEGDLDQGEKEAPRGERQQRRSTQQKPANRTRNQTQPSGRPREAAEPVPAEDADIAHWQIDEETLKYQLVGEFPDDLTTHRELLRVLRAEFSKNNNTRFVKICEVNVEAIRTLPETGQAMLNGFLDQIKQRRGTATTRRCQHERA